MFIIYLVVTYKVYPIYVKVKTTLLNYIVFSYHIKIAAPLETRRVKTSIYLPAKNYIIDLNFL